MRDGREGAWDWKVRGGLFGRRALGRIGLVGVLSRVLIAGDKGTLHGSQVGGEFQAPGAELSRSFALSFEHNFELVNFPAMEGLRAGRDEGIGA